ncbi:MAG TPA: zinc-ribbon domain-containing protein, partial [Ottowia sp.]|nr:zinc-ribbon domain-containing protein [Ottowia sp.]
MSLITRCPACATTFKVVPDQLRIAAGWVRCGHCQQVFDAAAHMLPYSESVRLQVPPPPPPP